ncbi:hypothetical protein BCR33DRAFT_502849 [Rhizoclosmatium globosum]|uniref:Uncharacterized protein n=1 Tax=Rhizoclosmatium globosum TaxID=329046 RepID=A0A1Y2CVP7_9FUNG|nr:hypothetical protein BCR33DRAFT_502849 [Rhizoclosmatium globosum]|eukprot:ORY51098.1 hypothetical protein BCR33DRAFT_502849 [Rhizoclosmatium globosum]
MHIESKWGSGIKRVHFEDATEYPSYFSVTNRHPPLLSPLLSTNVATRHPGESVHLNKHSSFPPPSHQQHHPLPSPQKHKAHEPPQPHPQSSPPKTRSSPQNPRPQTRFKRTLSGSVHFSCNACRCGRTQVHAFLNGFNGGGFEGGVLD